MEIFFLFAGLSHPEPHTDRGQSWFRSLHVLAQVCNWWSYIVRQTPKLWAVIDTRIPQQMWRTALRRSRAMPITVIDTHQDPEFSSAVLLHTNRWRSAYFMRLDESIFDWIEDMDTRAPLLESITLAVVDNINLFPGNGAPKLRSVNLSNDSIPTNWKVPTLASNRLTSFNMNMTYYSQISLLNIVELLETNATSLETFNLESVRLSEDGYVPCSDPTTVKPFAQLRSVGLSSLGPPGAMGQLLGVFKNRVPSVKFIGAFSSAGRWA